MRKLLLQYKDGILNFQCPKVLYKISRVALILYSLKYISKIIKRVCIF